MLSLHCKFSFFVKFSHDVFGPFMWQLCVLCIALSCFMCMVAPCFLCGTFCSLQIEYNNERWVENFKMSKGIFLFHIVDYL
jgi:hypothetical protein